MNITVGDDLVLNLEKLGSGIRRISGIGITKAFSAAEIAFTLIVATLEEGGEQRARRSFRLRNSALL
jgi:hypothetical protein